MDPVLPEDLYTGTVTVNDIALPVAFRLGAGRDGRLMLDVDPVDTPTYLQLAQTFGRPGQEREHLVLSAQSADGKTVTSDSVYVAGLGSNNGGHVVRLSVNEAVVTVPLEQPADRPVLQLWLRSFKSFRNSPVETPLGSVDVYGAHQSEGVDVLSGRLAIQAPAEGREPEWRKRAEQLLKHLHQGLALTHGGRLQVPIQLYGEGPVIEATFYAGTGFAAEFAVQPFLNHDPIIRALIDRFFARGPLPEVLWTALGWMHSATTFDEIRFLTAMTALETIIESQLSDRRGTTLPKTRFKPIRAALEGVIDATMVLTDTARAILKSGIAGINKRPFREKIAALFVQYEIPREDFSDETIASLVALRNEIVHRGMIPDGVDVWPMIILVRELITRILLREIGFVGRYDCYIGGQHNRLFPECVAA